MTKADLEKENAELKDKLNKYKHDCPNCPAFGKHCPHKVNGDPYFYDCYLTVCELEKEHVELKDKNKALEQYTDLADAKVDEVKSKLTKAKEIICLGLRAIETNGKCNHLFVEQAEEFLKEGR